MNAVRVLTKQEQTFGLAVTDAVQRLILDPGKTTQRWLVAVDNGDHVVVDCGGSEAVAAVRLAQWAKAMKPTRVMTVTPANLHLSSGKVVAGLSYHVVEAEWEEEHFVRPFAVDAAGKLNLGPGDVVPPAPGPLTEAARAAVACSTQPLG